MKTKIQSIIPAPSGLTALYEAGGRTTAERVPAVCLALCDYTDDTGKSYQEVRAMVSMSQQDSLAFAGECEGFLTLTHD